MNVQDAVETVCALARKRLDPRVVARARQRQADVLAWQDADSVPLLFGARAPELDPLPSFDWREQWHDPAKSFVEQMKGVVRAAASGSDTVPSLRADTGVVNGPSLFGAGFVVPDHTKPVVNRNVPKEALARFVLPDDIRPLGTAPRVVEHMEHHARALRAHGLEDLVSVHHCDTQGPFDIAAQTRGHDLFTDLYDDPAFVHHLMEQSTRAYQALSKLCKRVAGEPETSGNASGYWTRRGGVRLCDDSGILVSAALFEEFVLPYHARALEPFGGGWVHYCGGVPGGGRPEGVHLHDLYLRIPRLRGLNFTTGRDLETEIRKVLDRRVAFIGHVPRRPGEPIEAYFRRVLALCPGRKGMILHGDVREDEAATAMDLWSRAQDEMPGPGRRG